ncbi:MAG TPA: type VI secretion system tube protein TssD [Acidobacteriaceae bacterium]|jgi:type VI secretion system secreted protein Hcp
MRIGQVGRYLALCAALLPGLQAVAAVNAYMTIENTPQEKMKGELSRASSPERIRLISVAREASSGMATGKRMHKPITITKEIDASSPLLKQSMAKGSSLGNVVIVFEGAGPGAAKAAQKVVLTNAMVTGIKMAGKSEQISLDYQTIEVTYVNGTKTAADDWESPK